MSKRSSQQNSLLAMGMATAIAFGAGPAQAMEVKVGGFAGAFGSYDQKAKTVNFNLDETKIIPMVTFAENISFLSEFVYDFDRTATDLGKATGNKIPLKLEQVIFNYNFLPVANLTAGQMRIPFGFWDDLSAKRKAARIKNTDSILGFKLRKRDIGIQLWGDVLPASLLNYRLAVVNGNGENVNKDNDTAKDMVGRIGTSLGPLNIGCNGYWGTPFTAGITKYAAGVDYQLQATDALMLSGEFAYNSNNLAGAKKVEGSAWGGYVQANYSLYDLVPGLRLVALYDIYSETIGETKPLQTEYVGGFRYRLAPGVTWVVNGIYDAVPDETSLIAKFEVVF
ncbi:MAG: hypothetical protein HY692_00530 [Cyanobacteria bacterium NC_groundwater_1444_Ag_S-0.65um_54_12]|nr:hypothetical protein [Cyanobacteria bacterium NC_groundwater_1444_Ag_S-0.65um_54_12]